ncbi:MAG: bifunctional N(6)-L-threonylcarbamoyladenine synthase/serine/threonine protein kinase [Candidatus Aenigmatarchaeota archaeon]|nr:bifunctional N(6)-L-threonylcarbamoyladenine synthase/serine/threonine protein kinase [Candidatus Aenigmarchaeota archaeon]
MICLGIESTAHTFGAGIVTDSGKILANIKDIYVPKKGGIHPREAAEHHTQACGTVLQDALTTAKIKLSDINLVTFSQGPGLPPCLRIGAVFARTLGLRLGIPIIGVNHCVAHIEIGNLTTGLSDPVTLYVSGGNTQVIAFTEGRYRIFGETLDNGIGNILDQFARAAGLPHPGGPKIEQLAQKGSYIILPYVVKGMDLSFGGILSEAVRKFVAGEKIENICYSLQENCFAMLTEVVERAVAHTDKTEVLLTGGVAANKRLQEMLRIMCAERGVKFAVVPAEFAGDNGAMIAWTGLLAYKAGQRQTIANTQIRPKWRTDEVDVAWKV